MSEERALRIARMVANRVTDEMLTKPVDELSDGEVAILQAALRGPYADEIMERIDRLRQKDTA